MSDYHKNITNLEIECKKVKYKNELEGNPKLTEDSKIYLQNILNDLDKPSKLKEEKKSTNGVFNDFDHIVYKRYWHKLKPFHQKVKLKEYVEELKIKDNSKKEKLIMKLHKAIDLKVLTKKGSVEYDPFSYIIKSIVGLEYDNKKNTYSFTS